MRYLRSVDGDDARKLEVPDMLWLKKRLVLFKESATVQSLTVAKGAMNPPEAAST